MASEYFGLKGKLVRYYQEVLNSLGANIKINGKWGKKTENAFNAYRDLFLETIGAKESEGNPYAKMEFTPRTEEALQRAAENRHGASYDAQIEDVERAAQDEQDRLMAQMAALEPELEARSQSLADQYAKQRQTLSDEALSRGLGRSSYVTDQIAGSQKRETADAMTLAADTTSRKRTLEDSLFKEQQNAAQSAARLQAQRERSILAAIDEYRAADQQQALSAQKYNNELDEKYRKEQEDRRQFQLELANRLRLKRMK